MNPKEYTYNKKNIFCLIFNFRIILLDIRRTRAVKTNINCTTRDICVAAAFTNALSF